MRLSLFCHSLLSDWNHGNAHFLRGVTGELLARGHTVSVFEPCDAWSVENLIRERGEEGLAAATSVYPWLAPIRYRLESLDLERAIDGSDVVLVHEWNDPALVAEIGALRKRGGPFVALFHDTHHRMVTNPDAMAAYDLSGYDGVLAFGRALRDLYLARGLARRAWTWHEAADTRVFWPRRDRTPPDGDVVFIGNWGDEERTVELMEFLVEPVRALGLRGAVYGVRYPQWAIDVLERAGLRYRGWVPNFAVPGVFARYRVTVHVPRGPYARALPGIPTIRPFEALACGIPLVSAPWEDSERLFADGRDYLQVDSGAAMQRALCSLLGCPSEADRVAAHGRATVLSRHTCANRVDELLTVVEELSSSRERGPGASVFPSSSVSPAAAGRAAEEGVL